MGHVDWGKIMFDNSMKNKHRNAIIALAFLAIITMAGYYLAPSDAMNSDIAVALPLGDSGRTQCSFYSGDEAVECAEAYRIAEETYGGAITLLNKRGITMRVRGPSGLAENTEIVWMADIQNPTIDGIKVTTATVVIRPELNGTYPYFTGDQL